MPVSLIHFGFAGLALLTGTWVVMTPKGTARHRLVGYVYVVSMIGVLTTAFGMYYLFGRFGIVHWGGWVVGLPCFLASARFGCGRTCAIGWCGITWA